MMKIFKIFLMSLVLCSLGVRSFAASSPCYVFYEGDVNSDYYLRGDLQNILSGTSPNCESLSWESSTYAQSLLFTTEEMGVTVDGVPAAVRNIVLDADKGPIAVDMSKTTVVGNWTDADLVSSTTEGLRDYGYVIVNGAALDAEQSPFSCQSGSKNLTLRNMVILTNGVNRAEFFSAACLRDGGQTFVCSQDLVSADLMLMAQVNAYGAVPNDTECQTDTSNPPDTANPGLNWSPADHQILQNRYYPDRDGDGYGDADSDGFVVQAGDSVENHSDCDDANPNNYPGNTEVCDGQDNNCNGVIDEGFDTNGDGIPDCSETPVEVCNGVDDDSDGAVDEGLSCDNDGDGYLSDGGDCDDTNPEVNPAAAEECDGFDNNCDGNVDEGLDCMEEWFPDVDGDGYGDSSATGVPTLPTDGVWVQDNTDCNDGNDAMNPGEAEVCDGFDNNCDGVVDGLLTEGDLCTDLYYPDLDGDGYGDENAGGQSTPGVGAWVQDNTDCSDTNDTVHPNAPELCGDLLDNDCDDVIDEVGACVEGDLNDGSAASLALDFQGSTCSLRSGAAPTATAQNFLFLLPIFLMLGLRTKKIV